MEQAPPRRRLLAREKFVWRFHSGAITSLIKGRLPDAARRSIRLQIPTIKEIPNIEQTPNGFAAFVPFEVARAQRSARERRARAQREKHLSQPA